MVLVIRKDRMKISLTKSPDGSLSVTLDNYAANECDDLEIDIEPHAEGEDPHLYVTISREGDEVYEGRLPLKP
jgi:hypothetical protein